MLLLHWKTALTTALCAAAFSQLGLAQVAPTTILQIDVENQVEYDLDVSDLAQWATNPNVVRNQPPRNFDFAVGAADIVAVNGQPAKGTVAFRAWAMLLSTAPSDGGMIADIPATSMRHVAIDILQSDGTPVGIITAFGFGGNNAPPPPGAPLSATAFNFAVTGGTGAYLGARGQLERGRVTTGARVASITEDPAKRRVNGGGKLRWVLHLIPNSIPQIAADGTGPVITHADFSPVTAKAPARAGEVLIVRASGLGPTRPGVDPGQPFPSDAILQVNSPVAVTVNGQDAELVNSIGWQGLVDTYRVDFRVPDGATGGAAAIQLSAAWIVGPSVSIPVQ